MARDRGGPPAATHLGQRIGRDLTRPVPSGAGAGEAELGAVERRRLRVTGTVQGVGFRPFVYRLAMELGLSGSVANDSLGVVVEAEGPVSRLDDFARRLVDDAPPLARVDSFESAVAEVVGRVGEPSFTIVESRSEGAPAVAVSVDVATCDDCLAELRDPRDRRYRYPFINCTNCGPRYTIIEGIPYDRARTTMAGFEMCDACAAEYRDPADRRFHAEPVACPVCGPHLRFLSAGGKPLAAREPALGRAAADLSSGRILAVKGLGGYHLACDAADADAVAELRRRKSRDDKPFAVMVADLTAARALCRLSPAAEAALTSLRRPIVLAPRSEERGAEAGVAPGGVAPGVAPGLPELGLMLPYTPLHVLLLEAVGRPLVITSGNLSDEPIAHDDADALARLGPLVDAMLVHDRPIHIRCDDSVVRSLPSPRRLPSSATSGGPGGGSSRSGGRGGHIATATSAKTPPTTDTSARTVEVEGVNPPPSQMLRRSRGYAPEPLALSTTARRQVLAVGAELKNTVSVAKGDTVVASHHIGDLEHLPAYRSFLQAVDHLCHLAGVTPDVVAHDLHPEYLSTKFALELDLPTLGVQHHHAHIASCLVEHRRLPDEPVLGVAFDGLGMGLDGTVWGGEFLVAHLRGFERVGHLRGVPLPGGNQAIREPWRMGLVWARAALGEAAAERYGAGVDERWPTMLALADRPDTLTTSSAGRLFDAVAALLGIRPRVTYEAQAAVELEARAAIVPLPEEGPGDGGRDWPAVRPEITEGRDGLVLDPSPLVAEVIAQRDAGTPVALVSAGFHAALGRSVADLAARLAEERGLTDVALSGGVFQNARLSTIVAGRLAGHGLTPLLHRHVPCNDGGISIGQAAVAAAGD